MKERIREKTLKKIMDRTYKRLWRRMQWQMFWIRVEMFFFNRKIERRLSYEKIKQRRHQKLLGDK